MLRRDLSLQQLADCLDSLWVFEIQGQDDAGAWVAVNFPQVHVIRCQLAWRGISPHIAGEWFEARGDDEELVSPQWFRQHIQSDHDARVQPILMPVICMKVIAHHSCILIPTGLHDPYKIDQGGWGGRYDAVKKHRSGPVVVSQ